MSRKQSDGGLCAKRPPPFDPQRLIFTALSAYLFESALKTNDYLQFAVITGCLRISKESIFPGLNHLNIISVLDKKYSEHFGFTEAEVLQMMEDYGVASRFPTMKEWYDDYLFGDTEVYNPWSVRWRKLRNLQSKNG